MGTQKNIVHILYVTVKHWQAKDTEPWVIMFLMTKDLENMRVNGLKSLVANTRLGTICQPHFKTARRYYGSIKIYVSLGTIIEPLALFLLLLLLLLIIIIIIIIIIPEFSQQIFEKLAQIKFHENPSSGDRAVPCTQTDGQTDMTDLTVTLCNFANTPKNSDL